MSVDFLEIYRFRSNGKTGKFENNRLRLKAKAQESNIRRSDLDTLLPQRTSPVRQKSLDNQIVTMVTYDTIDNVGQ